MSKISCAIYLLIGTVGGGAHDSLSLAVEPPDFVKSIPTPGCGISFDNLSDPELPDGKKNKNGYNFKCFLDTTPFCPMQRNQTIEQNLDIYLKDFLLCKCLGRWYS